jgi:hypothetical protein
MSARYEKGEQMSEVFTLKDHDAQTGITTTVHRAESAVQIVKTYDAEPFLELAAAERAATEGERWGEMRKVGTIPMAELSKFYRQDGGFDSKRCIAWLKSNPAFVSFSKVLK